MFIGYHDYYTSCTPGLFRDAVTQLPYRSWMPFKGKQVSKGLSDIVLPIYSNYDIEIQSDSIQRIIIIQHGNLRNANQYFCTAIQSLLEIDGYKDRLDEFLIIAPQVILFIIITIMSL